MPYTDWATVSDLKVHLDIPSTDTTQDDILTKLLKGTYQHLIRYLGQDLLQANYTEYYDGDGSNKIILDQYPLVSVTSVHDDTNRDFDSTTLIDSDDYYIDTKHGIITLLSGVFAVGIANVKVIYAAGYSAVPDDAKQALLGIASWYYTRAGTEGQTNETLGGRSVQFESRVPAYLLRLVDSYRKINT